jgi:hypothetical protein
MIDACHAGHWTAPPPRFTDRCIVHHVHQLRTSDLRPTDVYVAIPGRTGVHVRSLSEQVGEEQLLSQKLKRWREFAGGDVRWAHERRRQQEERAKCARGKRTEACALPQPPMLSSLLQDSQYESSQPPLHRCHHMGKRAARKALARSGSLFTTSDRVAGGGVQLSAALANRPQVGWHLLGGSTKRFNALMDVAQLEREACMSMQLSVSASGHAC